MVALVVLLATATIAGAFNRGIDGVWFVGAFIAGAFWLPVQVFFLAVFAGLLINQGAPARQFDAGLADRLDPVWRTACMGPNHLAATNLDWCLEVESGAVDV